MASSNDQWEFLKDVGKLIAFAESRGFKLTGGELKRSEQQQRLYVRNGRSQTMKSDHLVSMAIDFNIFFDFDVDGDKDYLSGALTAETAIHTALPLGEFWKSLHPNNYWGGDWGWDMPHFGRKS